jgi:hypothetical protein
MLAEAMESASVDAEELVMYLLRWSGIAISFAMKLLLEIQVDDMSTCFGNVFPNE